MGNPGNLDRSLTPPRIPGATGSFNVTVAVQDNFGGVSTQSYAITVNSAPPNQPPVITSQPRLYAAVGVQYSYQLSVTDPENDGPYTYSFSGSYPSGMSINSSGLVTWTPQSNQSGTYSLRIQVADSGSPTAYGFQTYTLTAASNSAPTLAAIPNASVYYGQSFRYDVTASDSDGDTSFTYTVTGPTGISIDAHGHITWTPQQSDVGHQDTVTVTATDPYGLASTPQSFTLSIPQDTTPPTVTLMINPNPVAVNTEAGFVVTAFDNAGIASLSLTVNGVNLPLDGLGTAWEKMTTAGSFPVVATATDPSGNSASVTETLVVAVLNDAQAPSVAITAPSNKAAITAPTTVTGTASDPNLVSWSLQVAPMDGSAPFQTIASGTTSITNGTLGTFDPTMLADGPYYLKLIAINNISGVEHIGTTEISVNVEARLKLGNLHLDFTDLTIPVAGIPITITRSYDTLNVNQFGDFGYGWSLSFGNFDLKVQQPGQPLESAGLVQSFTYGTRLILTRPGQAPEGFTFEPQPITTGYFTTQYYQPYFFSDPGESDVLTVPYAELISDGNGGYEIVSGTGDLAAYNPTNPEVGGDYTLTELDGLSFVIDPTNGDVLQESDRHNNTLTFTGTGISSNTGRAVTFTHNGQNEITAITDPRGNSIQYGYDNYGNLVSVTDRNGDPPVQFVYRTDIPHYLDHVVDPLGKNAIQASYNTTDHRLSGLTDATGNSTSMGYTVNTSTRQQTVTAPGTAAATLNYDTNGNVSQSVDPQGGTTNYGYDSTGQHLASQTVVDGTNNLTTSYTYDTNGTLLTQTDPNNNETRFTYDQYGDVLSSADALGNATRFGYDDTGDLTSTTSPTGVTTSSSYDTMGDVLSTTSSSGTTQFGYDPYGDLTSVTDVYGTDRTTTYDANGNATGTSWTWTNPAPPNNQVVVSTTNTINKNDQVTQTTGPTGTTSTAYDAAGRPYQTTDNLGGVATTLYDIRGLVIQTTAPDGRNTDTVYDAKGRVQYQDDPHFPGKATDGTETFYDGNDRVTETERLSNLVINVTTGSNPSSSFGSAGAVLSTTYTSYDAAGRTVSTTDALGHVVTYQYDNAGNQTEVDDTVNGQARAVKSTYDADNRLVSSTDALNHTTQYLYDGDGRVIKTIYADGTFSTVSYNSLGQKVVDTDQAGQETRYTYDAHGNLASVNLPGVPNPANSNQPARPTYNYTYDNYGDLLTETDPLGRTATFAYDQLNRKVGETLPLGQTESWTYYQPGEASPGLLKQQTDFDGNTIQYTYYGTGTPNVAPGQLAQETFTPAGSQTADATVSSTYNQYEQDGNLHDIVTDSRNGTIDSGYDVEGRLVSVVSPQGTITYTYNSLGQKTAMTTSNTDVQYAYDQEGRLTTVTADKLDGTSLGSGALTTSYTYDLNNNLLTTTAPNGMVETRSYDALNRLLTVVTQDSHGNTLASIGYGLDADGRRLQETDYIPAQSSNTRWAIYTYDAMGRLTQEVDENASVSPPTVLSTTQYTYDLASNRLEKKMLNGSGTVTSDAQDTYDKNDRLTQETYTAGSNSSTTTFTYDANGSTLTKSVTGNALPTESDTDTWDDAGRMVKAVITINGTTNTYVYTYDDQGMKVSEATNGGQPTKYLIDRTQAFDQVLEEYAPGGALAATYIRGVDLIFEDRGGTRSFYIKDGLGSTRALANSSQAVTDTYTFDAYGNLTTSTGTTVNPYLFAGQWFDAGIGQYYDRSRYYYIAAGRFTSRDSYDGQTDDPITQNHYAYADADPNDNIDPSGHDTLSGVLAAIGDAVLLASVHLEITVSALVAANPTLSALLFFGGEALTLYTLATDPATALAPGPGSLVNDIQAIGRTLSSTGRNAWIFLRGIDARGRGTGAVARITRELMESALGTDASTNTSGWWVLQNLTAKDPSGNLRARAHLIAKLFGGPGGDQRNIVALFQKANSKMKYFESRLGDFILSQPDGSSVIYRMIPYYRDSETPYAIGMQAVAIDASGRVTRDLLDVKITNALNPEVSGYSNL